MFKYYLVARPPSLGCQPNKTISIVDYGYKKYIEEICREAWGHVEYEKPLSKEQISDYELVRGNKL